MQKILHVDDSKDWRDIIISLFENANHEIVSFEFLKDAMAENIEKYDLVIVDGSLKYPDDGFEWAQELYKQGTNVILLSARNTVSEKGILPVLDKVDFIEKKEVLLKMLK